VAKYKCTVEHQLLTLCAGYIIHVLTLYIAFTFCTKCKNARTFKRASVNNALKVRLKGAVGSLQVLRQFEAARHAGGPVRDHRPLCLNLDDHIRVCSVVKGKGNNFRSLPGVVTHEDGQLMCSTCCHCFVVVVVVVVCVVAVVAFVVDPGGKCLMRGSCEAIDWCGNGQSMTSYRSNSGLHVSEDIITPIQTECR